MALKISCDGIGRARSYPRLSLDQVVGIKVFLDSDVGGKVIAHLVFQGAIFHAFDAFFERAKLLARLGACDMDNGVAG